MAKKIDTDLKETKKKKKVNEETTKNSSNKKVNRKKDLKQEELLEVKDKIVEEKVPKDDNKEIVDVNNTVSDRTEVLKVPDQVVKEALKKVNKEAKKQARKEFLGKLFDEFLAFLVIIIVICLVIGGAYYWYNNYYEEKEDIKAEEHEVLNTEYKVVSYTSEKDNIVIVNDNYLVEYNKDKSKIYKVMDRSLNVLFDGELEASTLLPGVDGSLYAYNDEDAESENLITLYKFKDDEFVIVKEISDVGYYYSSIVNKDNNGYYYLMGFYGEENSDQSKSTVYLLDGTSNEIENTLLVGDFNRGSTDTSVVSRNKDYVVVQDVKTKKYGLYDINANQLVIDTSYNELRCTFNNNFVVNKEGLTGILNDKSKKVLDYQYDFIDIQDGYYVVGKNNKLGIMDKDYKMITGMDFDFQVTNSIRNYSYTKSNTFMSYKVNDMILLVTNVNDGIMSFNNHKAYLISSNGEYETITETSIYYDDKHNFMYSYDINTDVYTIYDLDNDKIIDSYEVSLDNYELKKVDIVKFNDSTILINDKIYIDYKENKEVEIEDSYIDSYTFDIYSVKFDAENKKMSLYALDSLKSSFDCEVDDEYYVRNDGTFYFIIGNSYYSIEKIS